MMPGQAQNPYLSVIIPAYREGKNIRRTLEELHRELKKLEYPTEIIVVVDGSPDNTEAEARSVKDPSIRVLAYQPNHGKGYALIYGVKHARGQVISLLDAGGDFHPDHLNRFIKLLQAFDADIVLGSKRHPASRIVYPWRRRLLSAVGHFVIKALFNLNVRDTQVGIKVFKREVLVKVMPRMLVKQYMFDLELLVVAKRLGYNRIFEAPVNLNFNNVSSSVKMKAIFQAAEDTAAIFYRRYITHYYDKPHVDVRDT